MKHLISIASLFIFNLFILCDLYAEAIAPKDVGYFHLTEHATSVTSKPTAMPLTTLLVTMPLKLAQSTVVPTNAPALTAKGKKPPAGTIPISIDPTSGKVVLLLGYEQGNFVGFTDFGGSGDPTDKSREHTAVREFNEETCLAFWEDLTSKKIDRINMSAAQLERAATENLTQNIYPWYYTPRNKYYTCLLPVRYQTISDLTKKIKIVRNKVLAAPFHEKSDLAWVPLEDFIRWIKTGNNTPSITGKNGRQPMSWRFFGLSLDDFTNLKTNPQLNGVYNRTIKYLEDIIALNP